MAIDYENFGGAAGDNILTMFAGQSRTFTTYTSGAAGYPKYVASPSRSGNAANASRTWQCRATTSISTDFYVRLYFYLNAAPDYSFAFAFGTGGGENHAAGITTDRRLYVANNITTDTILYSGTSSYKAQTAANTVPLGEWIRVEAKISKNGSELRFWKASGAGGVDSTGTPHESLAPGGGGGSNITTAVIGPISYDLGTTPEPINNDSVPLVTDSWAFDTADWITSLSTAGTDFVGVVPI